MPARGERAINRLTPLGFIVGFGVVSMLGDFVYEGARAVVGPYLATLGAGAALVGFITGAGEAVALILRLVSGPVSDRTRRYWPIAIAGYAITMVSVPVLAAAQSLWQAALCVIGERFGKAVRSPSRDTMLAQASVQIGRGRAFGLHEALDQSGALIGPLVVAAMIAISGYRLGFLVLAAPAALALLVLGLLHRAVPDPGAYERAATATATAAAPAKTTAPATTPTRAEPEHEAPVEADASASGTGPAAARAPAPHDVSSWWRFSRRYWSYAVFTALTMTGFATFGVLSYHLQVRHVVPSWEIPVIYAAAMGLDAIAALASGRVYDRIGMRGLIVLPLLAAAVPVLSFSTEPGLVWAGAIVWGAATGVHESTMRAAVADLVPALRRGTAYGLFAALYGVAWLIGSTVIGALYAVGITTAIVFVLCAQAVALASFTFVLRARS